MENLENAAVVENENTDLATEFTQVDEVNTETTTSEIDNNTEDTSAPADYVKKDDEEEEKTSDIDEENSDNPDDDKENDDDKKSAKKYELLEEELNNLKESYSALQNQYQELVNFKKEIDNQRKDALIAEFYMLSDEDKAEVVNNKEKYTLDEIKAKLSVICFDKKINFTLNTEEEVNENKEEVVTYTINDNENNSLPDWVKAVKEQEKLG